MILLFAFCVIVGGLHLPSVRFPVQNYEFIQLCCGEPCNWLTFKINRTSNDIWLHNKPYISTSQTYHHAVGSAPDSEFFYFDSFRIRLFLSVQPPAETGLSISTTAFDGTFGIGPHSQLWAFWDNYTLSTQRFELGAYNSYSQRDPFLNPPILPLDETNQVTLADGTTAVIRFDLTTTESFIPYSADLSTALSSVELHSEQCRSYYDYLNLENAGNCESNVLQTDGFQSLRLSNGVEYQAVSYSDDNSLIVGTHFIDELVVFYSVSCNCLMLAEDAFALDYTTLMASLSILMFFLLVLWVVIAESPADRENEWEFRLMFDIQLFSYLIDVLMFYVAFHMLDWGRYVTQFSECPKEFLMYYLVIVFIASFLTTCWTAQHWRGYQHYLIKFRETIVFQFSLFILCQISFVWLAIVEQHETTANRILLAIIVSVALLFGTISSGLLYLKGDLKLLACLGFTLLHGYIFFFVYTLVPLFVYSHTHISPYVLSLIWIYFLILMPSLILVSLQQLVVEWKKQKQN